MIMRDCLVRLSLMQKKELCLLPSAPQLFFHKLLHVCDGAARFEADSALLRAMLYPYCLDRVSCENVSRWLAACQSAELIKLYTVGNKRFGLVLDYGQKERFRLARYPDETGVVSQPEHIKRSEPDEEK